MRSCAYEKYGWTDRVITSSYTSPHPRKKMCLGEVKWFHNITNKTNDSPLILTEPELNTASSVTNTTSILTNDVAESPCWSWTWTWISKLTSGTRLSRVIFPVLVWTLQTTKKQKLQNCVRFIHVVKEY